MAKRMDTDYELDELFKHFEKLVEKERKKKARQSSSSKKEDQKKEERYVKHDKD